MVIDLKDLKKIRTKLGLSQQDLSRIADVSQSFITKVEQGRLDPSYSKATRILNALENRSKKDDITAEKIMVRKVVSVKPADPIEKSVKKMRKSGISQMLVMNDRCPVGYVSESIILNSFLDSKPHLISEVMEEVPPIISKKTSLSIISKLLSFYQLVPVAEKGIVIGVITRSDVLGNL